MFKKLITGAVVGAVTFGALTLTATAADAATEAVPAAGVVAAGAPVTVTMHIVNNTGWTLTQAGGGISGKGTFTSFPATIAPHSRATVTADLDATAQSMTAQYEANDDDGEDDGTFISLTEHVAPNASVDGTWIHGYSGISYSSRVDGTNSVEFSING